MSAARTIKPDSSQDRLFQMLCAAFGSQINNLLVDEKVIEIMLNPDGYLWVERFGEQCMNTGVKIKPEMARQVIELIATYTNTVGTAENPIISAELPVSGHRFEGVLPPVAANPTFDIRKKANIVYSLDDYVSDGILTDEQKKTILEGVYSKQNILVAGSTGSGKTTFLNAILDEISKTNDRLVIIEDTVELQCTAPNVVPLRSQKNVGMNALLRSTLRLRPDRIIVGEVRGPEALDLLKAWNTGHPGGCASIHANSCKAALTRLESLIKEAKSLPQPEVIADAVNLIVFIEKYQKSRRIKEIVRVHGYENGKYALEKI